MFYSLETMKFWKVLFRLFHGKALRFMSGTKSTGKLLSGSSVSGIFDSQETSINFAVPSAQRVSSFNPVDIDLPSELPAGIIQQAIDLKQTCNSYVLSVDGKKLAPGLNQKHGDQDLFGYEECESLEDQKFRIENEIGLVENIRLSWEHLPIDKQITNITNILALVSCRIKDLRILFKKQTLALRKFQKEAGDNWRTSRYVYAISSVQAMIFQIQVIVKRLLDVNNSLLKTGACLQSSQNMFVERNSIDSFTQKNWISLKEPDDLPDQYKGDIRFTKQRSDQWFEARKEFKVTGSKIFEGIGLDSLKALNKHFDKVIKKINIEEEFSDEAKQRMEHGTKCEIHAVATLVGKILPFYYPNLKFVEEGAHVLYTDNKPLVLVSPDGSLSQIEINSTKSEVTKLACEFKCPCPTDYKTPVHYEIPQRYISQILGEMAALNTPDLLYLSWTEESTTVIKAKFDEDLWNLMESEIKNLYGIPIPKKPTRISENVKNIKLRMKSYNENFTEFLCEVPSLKGTCTEIAQTIPESPYLFPIHIETISIPLNNMDILFTEIISSLREAFEICRKKASEVLVWLLSDTDRNWNEEIPHSLPIGYAMKGYSLPTSPMRNMHNAMLQACYDKDIHIACSCFDGQWIKLASRDASDKPLTLLQLQRDVSEKSRKTSRDVILNELTRTPIAQTLEDLTIDKKDNGGYYVSCSLYSKIMRCIISYKQIKQRQPVETDEDVLTSDITSYLPEVALEALIENETETDFIAALDSTGNQTEESELDTSSSANISAVRQIDQTTSNASLSDSDYQYILQSLISHQKSSVQAKWKDKDVQILKKSIADTQILKKLSHDELNVIIGSTEQLQKKAGLMIRKSWRILEKVNGISKLVGDGKQIESERKVRSMLTLREFAARRIKGSSAQNTKRVPKDILNLVYSTISYQAAYIDWIAKCPFDKNVEDIGSTEWFSYPEFNDIRQKLEPACIDAHHLLVNLRSKVCKDGLQNIRKQAWVAVANKNRDIISKSLVVDIIDKQNNAFAKRTFSRDVEIEMRNLAFDKEADFCQIVREWYEAEDTPGFSSKERIRRKLRLKEFLLEGVDFGQFPMFGMYVKGFPKVMFEGFLQRIDTTIQLYSIVKSGTYNHRAISSLVNETFFGELSDMEPTRLGCPKAISIPRLMSTVTEIFHYRCDPSERSFRINTTRKAVYPEVQLVDNFVQPVDVNMQDVSSDLYLRSITLRDHLFDKPIRRRRKQRTTKRSDVSKPGEVARGCLPIRQHHKTDESKILPTTRLGIDMKDLDGK